MNTSNHFLLGLLFIAALTLLGYFTLFLSDFTLFGEVQQLTVHFPTANGLREGDSVLVAGVRWGKVTTITYDPKTLDPAKRITTLLSLDEPVTLHEGHQIMIEDATLLGGKNLTIDPGAADAPIVPADAVLLGSVQLNVVEAAGELITKNGDAVTETIATLRELDGVERGRGTVGKLFSDEELADDVERAVKGAADSMDSLREISGRLERGEGALGQLIVKDEIYTRLQEVGQSLQTLLDEANATVADMRAGRGLAGALLIDEALSKNAKEGMEDLRKIIGDLNSGQGSLGKLLKEDSIAVDLQTVMDRLARGEGTVGRLLAEDEVYENVRVVSSDLRDIVAQVRDGRGTIGKLIMEEGMYTELLKAVGLLTRSLEEYREAAPISTMTNVIFGAF
jgi:phospholipid/cholesterol/gamma-HCH transport system substrate-binding protein